MLELTVPGFKTLRLNRLVLDFNGTIACDGRLIPGVAERLAALKEAFDIYVITADTFGSVQQQVAGQAQVKILQSADHREEKRAFIAELGEASVVAFGNGRNDAAMLKSASVGVVVSQCEGASTEALLAADILCHDICDGLDLLRYPKRLLATLRA